LTIFFFIYYYFYRRFIVPTGLSQRAKKKWNYFLIFLIYSTFLPFLFMRHRSIVTDNVSWLAYFIFGFAFTLLPLVFARDISWALFLMHTIPEKIKKWQIKKSPENIAEKPDDANIISRKDFLVKSNFVLMGAAGLMTGLGYAIARKPPLIYHSEVIIPDLPEYFNGYKIAQISDIHTGLMIDKKYLENVVKNVNQLKPDIIAITGDLVDGRVKQLKQDIAPLMDLSASRGKYFVTGNHEYYSGVDEWIDEIEKLGIKTLMNTKDVIYKFPRKKSTVKAERNLVIAGVPDFREGPKYGHIYDPELAIDGVSSGDIKILLAHQPVALKRTLEAGYHLQLSGHTHGGQFFPWNMFVGLVYPYNAGLYLYANKMWIYVNRGTGYWGPPLRLGVPSEITLITLVNKGKNSF